MKEPGFSGLLIVVAVGFGAPFLLGLAPRLRLPSVVFEIVAGIVIGPSVLGWVKVDDTISVLALMGLAILLFLAGLEIDFSRLRGRLVRLALVGWVLSFVIAYAVALGLKGAGLIETRLRAAMLLMIAFVALAETLGLEVILGSFAAGALLSLLDQDRRMTHANFRTKLEAIGFGLFIPVFFVTSGVRFDLSALLDKPSNLVMVPIFLAALLAVRGLPALVYRGFVGARRANIAGVLQATSLPFIVAATAIGQSLDLMDAAEASALIAAGLMSVLIFPLTGLTLLRRAMSDEGKPVPEPAASEPAPQMAM